MVNWKMRSMLRASWTQTERIRRISSLLEASKRWWISLSIFVSSGLSVEEVSRWISPRHFRGAGHVPHFYRGETAYVHYPSIADDIQAEETRELRESTKIKVRVLRTNLRIERSFVDRMILLLRFHSTGLSLPPFTNDWHQVLFHLSLELATCDSEQKKNFYLGYSILLTVSLFVCQNLAREWSLCDVGWFWDQFIQSIKFSDGLSGDQASC